MRFALPEASMLLALLREAVRSRGTNPYQIAKATGIPLRSVQNLLKAKNHQTLRNLEGMFRALGYEVNATVRGDPQVRPGTGRGHGRQGKQRGQ